MAGKKSGKKRKSGLNPEDIVTAALELVEAEGLEGFSFRKLAKQLGCEAMSIYYYFASKQHLIDAMVTRCIQEVPVPPADLSTREMMLAFAHSYRAMILRHPAFALIITTHRLNHREALEWLDASVEAMFRVAIPTDRMATIFRVFSYFLTGAVIDEALGYAKGPSAAEPYPMETFARDFPHIAAIGQYFGPDYREGYFDTGIELLMDWFEREVALAATPPEPEQDG